MKIKISICFILLNFLLLKIAISQTIITYEKIDNSILYNYFNNCDSLLLKQNKQDSFYIELDTIKIKIIITYKQGKKIQAVGYYSNGTIFRETNFDGYSKHGEDVRWYVNGQKEYSTFYNHGRQISPSLDWYDNGNIKRVCFHFIDKKNVFYDFDYYQSGSIMTSQEGIESSEKGVKKNYYYKNGVLESSCIFNMGKQPLIKYDSLGNKHKEGYIYNVHFFLIGHWKEWLPNGLLSRDYYYNENIPNQPEGTWKWFDERGLIKEEYYQNGKKISEKVLLPDIQNNIEKLK